MFKITLQLLLFLFFTANSYAVTWVGSLNSQGSTGNHYGLVCWHKDTLTSNDDRGELLDSKNNRELISEGSLLRVKEPTNKVLLYIFEDKTIKLENL